MSEPVKIDITNSDLEPSIHLPGNRQESLYIFALKDIATVTLNLLARTSLTALARKLSKLYPPEADQRQDLVFSHGEKDEDGNVEVKRSAMLKEDKTLDDEKWKKWETDIRAWRSKVIHQAEQIRVPVYASDVEILNADFLTALGDLIQLEQLPGDRPDSLRKENEKLKKQVKDLEATIKTITETVQKKRD